MRIAVIGAGLSGLAAARTLHAAGHTVTVFEKGRQPGGRLTSRLLDHGIVDHGAAAVDAPPGTELGEAVAEVMASTTDATRMDVDGPSDADAPLTAPVVFAGGLAAFARRLGAGLDLRCDARVARIDVSAAGVALDEEQGGRLGVFDRLVLSAPAPQAADLLARAPGADARVAALGDVMYDPAVVVALGLPVTPPARWLTTLASGPLRQVVVESAKGRPHPAGLYPLVLRFSADLSGRLLDQASDEDVTRVACDALRTAMDLDASPEWRAVKRWRYGIVRRTARWDDLNPPGARIVLCGDSVSAPGMPATFASGLRAARQLLAESS